MKVLIAYMSVTGNTKKIAEAIFEEIDCDKDIKEIKDIDELEGYDFYFLGFPMMNFGPNDNSKKFLKEKTKGKKIALFVTHGSPEWSLTLPPWLNNFVEAVPEAQLVGMFNCEGKCSQAMLDLLRSTGNPDFIKMADTYVPNEKPDEVRIKRAKEFAKEVMQRIS